MLNWKGDALKRKVERASVLGIDATMSAAIIHAKSNHGAGAHGQDRFVTHFSALEGGTRITQRARPDRSGVVGRWGVINVVYARRIELGFQGKDSAGRVIDAQPFPYLRPAAQAEYPKLAGRIKRGLTLA